MNIESLIEEWETFRRRAGGVASIIRNLPPASSDTIFRCPEGDTGVSLSADCISQIWAGDSRLVLDGREGTGLLYTSNKLGIRSLVISLLCENLTIGNLALSKKHYTTTEPTLLSPGRNFNPDLQLVVGPADISKGQTNTPLGQVIEPTSLMEANTEVTKTDWSSEVLKRLKKNG